jgi:hypothetical protein
LLNLTTILRRLAAAALLFLVWTPVAHAWTRPVQGPVLQPFAYDESHPYAAGQHRGIDIGADGAGETVLAPAAGTVSFAGTVPTSGRSLTIETPDGYSVTLTHLGSTAVAKGAVVAEGDEVGTIGPSGTPEVEGPYVHLGIRITTDPNGYIDPLSLLPSVAETGASDDGSTATQPGTNGGSASTAPTTAPQTTTVASTPVSTPQEATVETAPAHATRHRVREPRTQRPHADARPQRRLPERRPTLSQPTKPAVRVRHRPRMPGHRVSEPVQVWRRPGVEVAAPVEPVGLGAGHESRPRARPERPGAVLSVICNGVAALVALTGAIAAGRRRRGGLRGGTAGAEVLQLIGATSDRHARRAA